jgi:hypothetical protein
MDSSRSDGYRHVGERWGETRVSGCPVTTDGAVTRLARLRLAWRRSTASLRVMPDFVIVGAQKAGTTSLYAYLTAQPDVLPAASKEVHFFDTCDWERGAGAYRAYFPTRAWMRVHAWLRRRPSLTGEASPYYLYHPLAAERLAATVPDAKVLILLRDPVERTLSHYWHEVRGGREHLPLREALEVEPERLRGREAALRGGAPQCRHRDHQVFSYLDRSRYAPQVARYLERFPARQVLVVRSELLFGDDGATKQRIGEFLGLPELVGPFAAQNLGRRPARDGEEAAARELIARELAGDAQALRALLGDAFSWPAEESPPDEPNVAATDSKGRNLSQAGARVSP